MEWLEQEWLESERLEPECGDGGGASADPIEAYGSRAHLNAKLQQQDHHCTLLFADAHMNM